MPLSLSRQRFADWYQRWLELVTRPFPSPMWAWVAFVILSSSITLIITVTFTRIPSHVAVGQLALHDIRSDHNYSIVDKETSRLMRDAAAASTPSIFVFDLAVGNEIADHVRSAFDSGRRYLDNPRREEFEKIAATSVTDAQWSRFVKSRFSKAVEDSIVSAILGVMHNPITSDKSALLAESGRGVEVIEVSRTGEEQKRASLWGAKEISTVWSLDEAKKRLRQYRDLQKDEASSSFASQLVQVNFSLDAQATRGAREDARLSISDATVAIQNGEIIIRNGERFDTRHQMIIEGIHSQRRSGAFGTHFLGYFILVSSILWVGHFFGSKFIRRFRLTPRDARFVSFMLVVTLITIRFSIFLGTAIASSSYIGIPSAAFTYTIPVAMGAMLVRLVLNAEVALVFAVGISIFSGFFVLHDPEFTAYCLLSNIAAASFIANVDKRSGIMHAGLKTAAINMIVATGLMLVQAYHNPSTVGGEWQWLWFVAAAFFGGIMNSVLVLFAAPIVETVFGYTSDMKLLELANLNHPLLRELIIRAPGTYHHSHLVGILAESAAENIGANALLARVGAYYHDIGKMRKPQYYVENSKDNANWYERVNPHMAALIIASHIKDGIEMARQHRLPQQIIDMIPQHHGTKMISFFYELAKKSNDPELEKLSESDFRYPGPKPQSQEAGILLLADGCEAASRALKEKTPARIQQTVENIINKSFVESQLDECDLTLKDLTDIANAFTHILTGIYHQRIEYPKQVTEVAEEDRAL